MLSAGIAIGQAFTLPFYLPLLAIFLVASTLLRHRKYWCGVLILTTWFLIGGSRASISSDHHSAPRWQKAVMAKATSIQITLANRLSSSGVSSQTLALTQALAIGKKDNLSDETRKTYQRVGASHLLALSGMHLGILYTLLHLLFVRWVRHSHWRWHVLPLILVFLWGYALVAGLPVSLVRAALMLSIMSIMSFLQYRTDPLHPLALSAIVILLIAPSQLYSISFQLSFSAVFFILLLWEPASNLFGKINWAVRLLGVSCVATLGTMPLIAYHFHEVSLIGPLLSLVLIPLTTLIIWLTFAAMLVPITPLGWLLDSVTEVQNWFLSLAGSIPYTTLTNIHPSILDIVLIYAVLLVAAVRLRTEN